jgi:hypothetical protein
VCSDCEFSLHPLSPSPVFQHFCKAIFRFATRVREERGNSVASDDEAKVKADSFLQQDALFNDL